MQKAISVRIIGTTTDGSTVDQVSTRYYSTSDNDAEIAASLAGPLTPGCALKWLAVDLDLVTYRGYIQIGEVWILVDCKIR